MPTTPQEKKITKVIDKFYGTLTRENIADMNSGKAKFETTFGNNPFINPSNLTWFEQPASIVSLGQGDGPIVNLKTQINGQNISAYGVTTTSAKLYQIQSNKDGVQNSNYDTASVVSTLSNQIFTYGGGIEFYGGSVVSASSIVSKMYIGGDSGMSTVYTDGSSPTFVSGSGYITNVPRPTVQFLGKLYFGNGNNIGEIDSTETITTFTKLSPGLPTGLYIRDLDVTPDGNYMIITASRIKQAVLNGITSNDVTRQEATDSYKFLWNGSDLGVTSYQTYSGLTLTSSTSFADKNYSVGFDLGGASLYEGSNKNFTLPNVSAPNFSAMAPIGNMLSFATTVYDTSNNRLKGDLYFYGQYDKEIPNGLYRLLRYSSGQGTDVLFVPALTPISNLFYVPSFYQYTNNIAGTSKAYFTSSEVQGNGGVVSAAYFPVYKFNTDPTGAGSVLSGVYETQNEIFSKKIKPTEVRFYTEPLASLVSFKVDLIGSSGDPISGGTQTFTVSNTPSSSTISAGQDYVWYNPATAPTHNLGVRITNLGSVNWVGIKMELDLVEQGK